MPKSGPGGPDLHPHPAGTPSQKKAYNGRVGPWGLWEEGKTSEQHRVCFHCRGDENRPEDPWVPYMFSGEQMGWMHQSCLRTYEEQHRARAAADAVAERKDRTRKVVHNVGLFAVWAFLIWFGFTAIDLAKEEGDTEGSWILSLYVLFTAFAAVALLDKLWKAKN
jgi:hypothetical protein